MGLWRVVRADLLVYKTRMADSGLTALVIARSDGDPYREHDYKNLTVRKPRGRRNAAGERTGKPGMFVRAAAAAGLEASVTPYWLRHSAASIRIAAQQQSLQEIADEMGHTVEVLANTYAHVISEYRGQGPFDPDEKIRAARTMIADAVAVERSSGGTPDEMIARARIGSQRPGSAPTP